MIIDHKSDHDYATDKIAYIDNIHKSVPPLLAYLYDESLCER